MDQQGHSLAIQALEAVLLGRAIIGMYFSGSNLWFNDPDHPSGRDAYLRIENSWALVDPGAGSDHLPEDLRNDYRELARVAASLAESRVQSIRLGTEHAHLWLTFDDGQTLFVCGKKDCYESWELSYGDYMVVALAGGDVAVWSPS